MTPNKVTLLIEKFGKNLSQEDMRKFTNTFKSLDDSHFESIVYTPLKSKLKTILFAVLLGGIGADRFYIGDKGLGILKLIINVGATLLRMINVSALAVVSTIISIAGSIYLIADMFISYKKCLKLNCETLNSAINQCFKSNVVEEKPEEEAV